MWLERNNGSCVNLADVFILYTNSVQEHKKTRSATLELVLKDPDKTDLVLGYFKTKKLADIALNRIKTALGIGWRIIYFKVWGDPVNFDKEIHQVDIVMTTGRKL